MKMRGCVVFFLVLIFLSVLTSGVVWAQTQSQRIRVLEELKDQVQRLEQQILQQSQRIDALQVRIKVLERIPELVIKEVTPEEGVGAVLEGDVEEVVPELLTREQMVYAAAYDLMVGGEYVRAQEGFLSFIEEYTGHGLVSYAYYWLGEMSIRQDEYRRATEFFTLGSQERGSSPYIYAEHLLKISFLLGVHDENYQDACRLLQLLLSDLSVPFSHKRRAQSFAQNFACSG